MKALVIYESIFGNTMKIAEAISEGLASTFDVTTMEVGTASDNLSDVSLLVVGGPTHVWGMTRASSRKGALNQAGQRGVNAVSKGIGIRDWIQGLEKRSVPVATATFDTAIKKPRWFPVGSAARSAWAQLKKKNFDLIVNPEQFYVADTGGPLMDGEVDRARQWSKSLGEKVGQALMHKPVMAEE